MREFEQALQRARASGKRRKLANDPPAEELMAPHTEPAIEGVSNDPKAPLEKIAAPAPEAAGEGEEIAVLKANFSYFRDNFGAAPSDARNVDGAFRILRTQVLTAMQDRSARILGITSPAPGAGKSVTAIHLALACARRAEQRVVLADFDFRHPSVARYLDASGFRSSIGYFQGEGHVTDYVSRNEAGNLQFLLTDRSSEMSAEFIASSRMDDALHSLSQGVEDTILIADLPPLQGCDDTLAMLPKLDGIVLVVAAGESNFAELERTVSMLPTDKIIATVLNKVEGPALQYDYYY